MRHIKAFFNEVSNNYTFDVDVRLVDISSIDWKLDRYLGQVEYTDGSWVDIFYQMGQLVGVETEGE